MRRDPHPPDWYIANLGWARYLAGHHDAALVTLQTLSDPVNIFLIATYARLGRVEEARALVAEYTKRYPSDSMELQALWPIRDAAVRQGYLDDLRKAGFPERK